jgi:hypothetical protein
MLNFAAVEISRFVLNSEVSLDRKGSYKGAAMKAFSAHMPVLLVELWRKAGYDKGFGLIADKCL